MPVFSGYSKFSGKSMLEVFELDFSKTQKLVEVNMMDKMEVQTQHAEE